MAQKVNQLIRWSSLMSSFLFIELRKYDNSGRISKVYPGVDKEEEEEKKVFCISLSSQFPWEVENVMFCFVLFLLFFNNESMVYFYSEIIETAVISR